MSDHTQQSIVKKPAAQDVRDERRLVKRLLAGERAAWSEFIDRYQRVIFARVNQVLMHSDSQAGSNDCDDVVADLFALLLAKDMRILRRFEHRSTLATWLTVIAHRMSLRAATKSRRAGKVNGFASNADEPSNQPSQSLAQLPGDPAENPLEQLVNLESRSKLRLKLAMLKQADRQVLELFHFENLGYREIALRMGMSENSVGPRLTRAIRRLKRLLEDAI